MSCRVVALQSPAGLGVGGEGLATRVPGGGVRERPSLSPGASGGEHRDHLCCWCPAGFPEDLRVTPWGGGRGLRPSEQRRVTASGGAESRRMGRGRAWRRVQGGWSAGPSGWGTAKGRAGGTGPGATNNAGPGLPSPLTPRGSRTALPTACTLPPRPSGSRMLRPQGSLGPGVSPGAPRVPPAHQPQSLLLFSPPCLSQSFLHGSGPTLITLSLAPSSSGSGHRGGSHRTSTGQTTYTRIPLAGLSDTSMGHRPPLWVPAPAGADLPRVSGTPCSLLSVAAKASGIRPRPFWPPWPPGCDRAL